MAQGSDVPIKAEVKLTGIVQGVGFRPFVARLAARYHVSGWVKNDGGHVHIEAIGADGDVRGFVTDVINRPPPGALISSVQQHIELLDDKQDSTGFVIRESGATSFDAAMISPDIAVCDDCLRELMTADDPRYRSPFISCVSCGPRYSIIDALPYDRDTTTMADFDMCPLCGGQYHDTSDRRCHAQTVCCNSCGPVLSFRDRSAALTGNDVSLAAAVTALKKGKIIAVKGIGGYHLVCNPLDEDAVNRLRQLKGREEKAFAVMFPDLASIQSYAAVTAEEESLLRSPARPIVLLKRQGAELTPAVCRTSRFLGAFLPYTPLQALLLSETGPLVMTSANMSSLPIIKDDEEIYRFFQAQSLLDGVLSHNRPILRRLDDSVVAVVGGRTQFIRRARGYAPLAIPLFGASNGDGGLVTAPVPAPKILACGAQQKSAVALTSGNWCFPSAELGALDSAEAVSVYRDTVSDLTSLLHIEPDYVACDLHPLYESTHYAQETGCPLVGVQHHFAHIASVMAEHSLTHQVIGVAFDGTGYGTDGTIWGGEFLIAAPNDFVRAGHLKPVTLLGGDASIYQAWKTAICIAADAGADFGRDERAQLVRGALHNSINTFKSSSMGRVFDAVSALLDICAEASYEGQCAVELENAAAACPASLRQKAVMLPYDIVESGDELVVDLAPSIRAILALNGEDCPRDNTAVQLMAYRFHLTVCGLIVDMCTRLRDRFGIACVALSGGVFQNRILLEATMKQLETVGFTVYLNEKVPPNDGGIALGQAYAAMNRLEHQNI